MLRATLAVFAILFIPIVSCYAQAGKSLNPTQTHAKLIILLTDLERVPIAKADILIAGLDDKPVASGKTNKEGYFECLVPIGKTYWVGVEDSLHYSQAILENKPFAIQRKKVLFQGMVNGKMLMPERPVFSSMTPLDGMAKVEVKLIDAQHSPISGEVLTLKALSSGQVYKDTTGADGSIIMQVPIGDSYQASLQFFPELDKYHFPANSGSYSIKATYGVASSQSIMQARLMRAVNDSLYNLYRAASKGEMRKMRDAELHKLKFAPVPVYPLTAKLKITETPQGQTIELGVDHNGASSMHNPIVAGDLLICTAPWANNYMFAVNLKTMQLAWAVKLGEGGPCAAVATNGLVVVITESCTIYVINQNTGILAWSGYLSHYVLSAAALDEDHAYVVYSDDVREVDPKFNLGTHSLACFELKTGKVAWQQWVLGEAMGFPVVSEGRVFLNTFAGYSYVFDAASGSLKAFKRIYASSPPTPAGDRVYMSVVQSSSGEPQERIASYSVTDLSLKYFSPWYSALYMEPENAKSPEAQGEAAESLLNGLEITPELFGHSLKQAKELYGVSTMVGMQHFQGSRPLVSGNMVYAAMGNRLHAFTKDRIEHQWTYSQVTGDQKPRRDLFGPIMAGGKLLVGSSLGKVTCLSAADGQVIANFPFANKTRVAPIAYKGLLISANEMGKIEIINSKDPSLDGWYCLGGNEGRSNFK